LRNREADAQRRLERTKEIIFFATQTRQCLKVSSNEGKERPRLDPKMIHSLSLMRMVKQNLWTIKVSHRGVVIILFFVLFFDPSSLPFCRTGGSDQSFEGVE